MWVVVQLGKETLLDFWFGVQGYCPWVGRNRHEVHHNDSAQTRCAEDHDGWSRSGH